MAEQVVITITGDDQASDDIRRVLGALKDNDQAVKDLSSSTEKGEESASKFGGGMGKMKVAAAASAVAVAALATAAVAAAGIISKLATAAAEHGDNAAKTAQKIGITTEAYQEYSHAAALSGANQQAVEAGFARLSRAAVDSTKGVNASSEAFDRLGVSAKDANGNLKSAPELTEELAGALSGLENETEKVALAQELFGRGGKELLPMLNAGSEGIANMRQEARDLGIVMSGAAAKDAEAYQDALLRLQSVGKGLSLQFGGAMLPALTALFDAFRTIIGPIGDSSDMIRDLAFNAVDVVIAGFGALIETLDILSPVITGFITNLKVMAQMWRIQFNAITSVVKLLVGGLAKGLSNIVAGLEALVRGAAVAADALGLDMAGSMKRAADGMVAVQKGIDDFSTAALDSAKGDMDDIGDSISNIGQALQDMPGMDAAISDKLKELAGRVQEAQVSIATARHTRPEADDPKGPSGIAPTPESKGPKKASSDADKKAAEEAARRAAEEAEQIQTRNDLARMGIEIFQEQDEIQKANLERQLRLMELATQEATEQEVKLEQLQIEEEHRKRLADIQKKAAADQEAARKKEADDLRDLAKVFKGTGSQMAGDVGGVIEALAGIKDGSKSSVDALGAVGQATAGFADQLGASAEAQAVIMAVFETAMGFATLWTNPAASAAHFLAAANFGIIAATGGGSAQSASGGGGGVQGMGGGLSRSPEDAARTSGKILAESLNDTDTGRGGDNFYIDFSGATMLESTPKTQKRIEDAVETSRSRRVKGGGRG